MEIVTRAEALALGVRQYFNGVPCPRGHLSARRVSGRVCVACARERAAEVRKSTGITRSTSWYSENREAVTARRRATYAANSERILASAKVRRSRPSYKQHAIEYAQRNSGRIAAYAREYAKKNRAGRRINDQNRNARLREAGGRLSHGLVEKLLLLQRGKCVNCRCILSESGHHLDHIVPVALGGRHEDHNIQLLCPTCNLKKNAKDPVVWAQEQGRLI